MSRIRTLQKDFLEQGAELIDFKRYSSDGTYLETVEDDVLFTAKRDLSAIDQSLMKEFERPLKQVAFKTKAGASYILNNNAHFAYDSTGYTITSPASGISEIKADTSEPVKAISYNKYFKSTYLDGTTDSYDDMIKTQTDDSALADKDLEIGFNYYIDTDDNDDAFELNVKLKAEPVISGNNYEYNFQSNEWEVFPSNPSDQKRKSIAAKTINSWAKAKINISAIESVGLFDKFWTLVSVITATKPKPHNDTTSFNAIYIDNFYIAQKSSIEGDSQVTKRKRLTSAGNFTGDYESKDNILASVGIGSKKFAGEIVSLFTYRRPRDTENRTLEQITTQEIINDHRESLIRYEGTLRSSSRRFLGMHHKIWFNYVGYTDPVSCYIDGMKYNVKKATYDVQLHMPNQDNDVDSVLEIKYE